MSVLSERYSTYLLPVRKFTSMFLPDLIFENKGNEKDNAQRTLERLRLSAALFNDLQPEDYVFVRFLFGEELKARRSNRHDDQQFFNLRLTGFLLSRYKNPDDIWALFEAHTLEAGFDIEHVMHIGVLRVFEYLDKSKNKNKARLIRKIGSSVKKSKFTQIAVTAWLEEQEDFFDTFRFPLKDEITFALIMQEPERIRELLPQWIEEQKEWTSSNALQYIGLAKGSGDCLHEINALKLYTSTYDDTLTQWFKHRLAELYIFNGKYLDGIGILNCLLKETDDKELNVACIKELCEVVIKINDLHTDVSKSALRSIDEHSKRYKRIPVSLKNVLNQVKKIRH